MYFSHWKNDLLASFDGMLCKIKNVQVSHTICFDFAKKLMGDIKKTSKKIVIIGNGGSAAIASHISQDIINKLKTPSFIISDASLITCVSNDAGYKNVFAQPLDVLLFEGDLLIAISDSGESANILESVKIATLKKCAIITLSAFKPDNSLLNLDTDISIHMPTVNYGIAEISHLAILHSWVDELAGVLLKSADTASPGISA